MTIRVLALAAAALMVAPSSAPAADLSVEERSTALTELTGVIESEYPIEDTARAAAAALRQRRASYEAFTSGADLAERLTNDLRELTRDKHMRVVFEPAGQKRARPRGTPPAPRRTEPSEADYADNFGFAETRLLQGNVGYLRLSRFADPLLAGATATAAMQFLANTDAMIFDVRQSAGGDPALGALLSSYFVGPDPVVLATVRYRADNRTEYLGTTWVPGKRDFKKPVYVLTSRNTFSAPESLAYYLQAIGRAKVVGEVTAGGAMPGGWRPLSEHFAMWTSTGHPSSPATGTNWEGTGVRPDLAVTAREALQAAHRDALSRIAESSTDDKRKNALRWLGENVDAAYRLSPITEERRRQYAGRYGRGRIFECEQRLCYESASGVAYPLLLIRDDLFAIEGVDHARIQFERSAGGTITGVAIVTADAVAERLERVK